MAIQEYNLTATPVNLRTELTVEDDTHYRVQYHGTGQANIHTGTTAPAANTSNFMFLDPAQRTGTWLVASGENLYAWSLSRNPGSIKIDRAS